MLKIFTHQADVAKNIALYSLPSDREIMKMNVTCFYQMSEFKKIGSDENRDFQLQICKLNKPNCR